MTKILSHIHGILWGAPVLLLIIGVGLWFTVRCRCAQITLLPRAAVNFLSQFRRVDGEGSVSPFQALCTALAATVGTGNLVGVAGAICIGGPGAIFWMWLCGFLGMILKCAEATLAVHYRQKVNGEYLGGPMYIIASGMGSRWIWLAKLYAIFGIIASFGVGNTAQINAVVSAINHVLPAPGDAAFPRNLAFGLILAVATGSVLLGGARRIGSIAELLVPIASAGYMILCIVALVHNSHRIPAAFASIIRGAFSPESVTGGTIGSCLLALRTGCSRGVFTNEAGMGTASIAYAAASTTDPASQGLMGILEVFLDTIVICTLTALVILTSGVPIPYGEDFGGILTDAAFRSVFGSCASVFLSASLCCFAFATVLGWGLYGLRCAQFLFGTAVSYKFALAQTLAVIPGALMHTETVWLFSEIMNGLMAIPNLIVLAVFAPVFFRLMCIYERKSGTASGGYYADFHQRKPL